MGLQTIEEFSDLVTTQWQVKFDAIIKSQSALGEALALQVITDTEEARVPFFDRWPGLKQLGINEEKSYETLVADYITVAISRFANGLTLSKTKWSDSVTQSLVMSQIDALVSEVALAPTRRVVDVCNYGETAAYNGQLDGVPYFSTSHTINGYNYSNLIHEPLDADGFQAAISALSQAPLGPDGEALPLEGAEFHLVFHPARIQDVGLLLDSSTIALANIFAKNPWQGYAKQWPTPWLISEDDWMLFMTLPGVKPFATVRNSASTGSLIPNIADDDYLVRTRNLYTWDVDLLQNSAPIHPYQGLKSMPSSSS